MSFDIPIFTANRQDKQVQSAISKTAAVKTEKWLLIRKLIASFETNRAQLLHTNERQKLYQQRLLPQMHDQAEASLTAYTNDDGDFAEVVRSRIAELNATIDAILPPGVAITILSTTNGDSDIPNRCIAALYF